jgi:hypothetical protein
MGLPTDRDGYDLRFPPVVSTFDNPPDPRAFTPLGLGTQAMTRTFSTGATRDTDEGKLDFEGFLSPLVLRAFAEYMHEKRKMPDGSMRASDNWQLGIPVDQYMKSAFRHFFDTWSHHRAMRTDPGADHMDEMVTELLALFFNVQGMLHEILKKRQDTKDMMWEIVHGAERGG